jgi:hypothetical protein
MIVSYYYRSIGVYTRHDRDYLYYIGMAGLVRLVVATVALYEYIKRFFYGNQL